MPKNKEHVQSKQESIDKLDIKIIDIVNIDQNIRQHQNLYGQNLKNNMKCQQILTTIIIIQKEVFTLDKAYIEDKKEESFLQ